MAYAYYHPAGDDSNEVQVYIFEMGDSLKALGKYGTEKPDESKPIAVGAEGYTAAGSTLFYSGPYYTQIVSTKDDAKFSEFALALAQRIADAQKPGGPAVAVAEGATEAQTRTTARTRHAGAAPAPAAGSPEAIFALLPAGPSRAGQTYVPNDVFGYSLPVRRLPGRLHRRRGELEGVPPVYATPEEAKAVFEKYLASASRTAPRSRKTKAEGADRIVVVSNIGLPTPSSSKGTPSPAPPARPTPSPPRRSPRLREGTPRQGPGGRGGEINPPTNRRPARVDPRPVPVTLPPPDPRSGR